MSCHYFLLSPGAGRRLVLRMGEPGLYCPQSVAVYNSISVTAFVQTDQDQALDPAAFKLLLSFVEEDLQKADLPMPKYLLRYTTLHTSHQHYTQICNISLQPQGAARQRVAWLDIQHGRAEDNVGDDQAG